MNSEEAWEIACGVAGTTLLHKAEEAEASTADWSEIPENIRDIVVACTWDEGTMRRSGWVRRAGPRFFRGKRTE